MLVLTRKQRQQLHIGNEITITVVRVTGNTVRLGIEAPQGVRILRSELTSFDGPSPEAESQAEVASEAEENLAIEAAPPAAARLPSPPRRPENDRHDADRPLRSMLRRRTPFPLLARR